MEDNIILRNEGYLGNALLQKSYMTDTLTFVKLRNKGQKPQYDVEETNLAIIERSVFDRVQVEIAWRNSKKKTKEVGTKAVLGKYSGKFALSEILYCGECGKPYRRVTWNIRGNRKLCGDV